MAATPSRTLSILQRCHLTPGTARGPSTIAPSRCATHHLPAKNLRAARPPAPSPATSFSRSHFSTTPPRTLEKNESRENLDPTPSEYSKTGADGDLGAAHTEDAFDPSSTRPDDSSSGGGVESKADELDTSPQNRDVSRTKAEEGEASAKSKSEAGSGGRDGASGQGRTQKGGDGREAV